MNYLTSENAKMVNRPEPLGEAIRRFRQDSRDTRRLVSSGQFETSDARSRTGFRVAVALFTCLFLAWFMFAADAADAAPYKGKTKGGSSITFNLKGMRVTGINTVVPTICLETTGNYSSRAGGELFRPTAPARIGRTVKSKALQPAALNLGIKATKNYEVTLKKRGRLVTGQLKLNYSFLVPDLYGARIFICSGSTSFSSKPR